MFGFLLPRRLQWACAGLAVGFAGCNPAAPIDLSGDNLWPTWMLSGKPVIPPSTSQYLETEPNDSCETAETVLGSDAFDFVGTIAPGSRVLDRDVYQIGPAQVGDRVQAAMDLPSGGDVVLGLLDDQERLLAYVDPTSSVTGPGAIDMVIHESTSRLDVVVGTRSASSVARPYHVQVKLDAGTGILGSHPQAIVLNFQGARQVRIGNRAPVDVPAFDAANIESRFAGQTEDIIALVLQRVREDYLGLDVEIYRAGDPGVPSHNQTVIYFGTYDARLLGLADNIDPSNADPTQSAILFTDTFAMFGPLVPTLQEIAQVLANVASHESAHLLGLRHTADPQDLMDVTASASQMLADQAFGSARLDESVLPLGLQDAPSLLAWTLGGSLTSPSASKASNFHRAAIPAARSNDFYIPRGLLSMGSCPLAIGKLAG